MNGVLAGYKTYLVALLAVIGAVIGYLTGDITTWQAVQAIGGAVFAATLRSGINTATLTAPDRRDYRTAFRTKPK